jgi:hypothetical protein
MTRSRHILRPRVRWTAQDEQFLRDWYPHVNTETLAEALRCGVKRVYQKASELWLRKDPSLIAEMSRTHMMRPDHGGRRTQFEPACDPWNKGRSYQPGGRSVGTRFQAGKPAHMAPNYLPIGSLRVTADGTLQRKVSDDRSMSPTRRWVAVARLVWEAENGPIPDGHSVVFRPGRKTTLVDEITPDALELLTRQEMMALNSVHRYPKELAHLIQLRGALTRKIRHLERKDTKS